MSSTEYKKSILLLGDGAVGKTSLIRRFVMDQFSDDYITTIGAKVSKKEMTVKKNGEAVDLKMMIWDIIGQKGYRSTQALSFGGIEGAILVCDITRKETLASLDEYWMPSLFSIEADIPVLFMANKCDLKDQAQFGENELKEMADKYDFLTIDPAYLETSAKTGVGVQDAFEQLGEKIISGDKIISSDCFSITDLNNVQNLIDVADHIMADFCQTFGGIDYAPPYLKKQIEKAGLDVKNPSVKGLKDLVRHLSVVETRFKEPRTVSMNKMKRMHIINKIAENEDIFENKPRSQ